MVIPTARREIETLLQSVLDGLAMPVCMLDESGAIVATNGAWRASARSHAELVFAARPDFDDLLREALAGQVRQFDLELPDGPPAGPRRFRARLARLAASQPPRVLVTLEDVTALKQTEEALQRSVARLQSSEDTYRTLFESVPQGIVFHDPDGRVTSANPAALRILGLTLAQLQGCAAIDPRWKVVCEDGSDQASDEQPSARARRTGKPVTGVVMGIEAPGRPLVWILVDATPLFDHGQLQQVHIIFEDITERVLLARELQRQAGTDYLTGVANRRVLIERLHVEYERLRRRPDRPCSVLALDLDHFKDVNDTWGHATGDAVLVHLARLMQQTSRTIDTVARYGGEEFALLLPDTSADAALALGERLRRHIEALTIEHEGTAVSVTVSMGVSTMSTLDSGIDAVLARADRALYDAKRSGRNAARLAVPPG